MDDIVCENVSKSYRINKKVIHALRDASFKVARGKIAAIIGPNGAGKTTLIRILSTLLLPDAGEVYVGGYDAINEPENVKKIIGYDGESMELTLHSRLTVLENLIYFSYGLKGIPKDKVISEAKNLAQVFHLKDKLDRPCGTLSTGELQRVVVMRAFIGAPRIALLDEPTKSLDPIHAKNVRLFLRKQCKVNGVTIFFSSHNMRDVEETADKVILINKGRIIFQGTPEALKAMIPNCKVIEIKIKSKFPEEIVEKIRENCWIRNVDADLYANKIRIYYLVEKEEDVIYDVISTLHDYSLRFQIVIKEPSIEEVFTSLVEKRL